MAAPLITPVNPFGMYGCQLLGFTMKPPNEMKKTTTATFTITMTVFARALSRIP